MGAFNKLDDIKVATLAIIVFLYIQKYISGFSVITFIFTSDEQWFDTGFPYQW